MTEITEEQLDLVGEGALAPEPVSKREPKPKREPDPVLVELRLPVQHPHSACWLDDGIVIRGKNTVWIDSVMAADLVARGVLVYVDNSAAK